MRPGAGKKSPAPGRFVMGKTIGAISAPIVYGYSIFRRENQALPLTVISPASALALPMGP